MTPNSVFKLMKLNNFFQLNGFSDNQDLDTIATYLAFQLNAGTINESDLEQFMRLIHQINGSFKELKL